MLYSLLKCFIIFLHLYGVRCQNPEVVIPQGGLRGGTRTNIDGGTYYSFQNIPYAQPPIGNLRFRAPLPADSWDGIRDATQDLPQCVQDGNSGGQEDCLYLNVYTRGLPAENITQLPVMVFIHGGGFVSGSGSETDIGAQFLLIKDVILVAINYRVGIFGFFSLDDPNLGVTGNAGLKDQVLALQWIQDNIEYFGGNPNNVMIFGESAGSMSVQFQLLSPMSNGLFHRAISQSGDSTTGLVDPVTRNNGEVLANLLGIQTDDWEAMLASLQEVPAGEISSAEAPLNPMFKLFPAPIAEVPSNVGPRFLEDTPINIIRNGAYNRVPFIIGTNDAEGLLFQFVIRAAAGESILIEDFTQFIPNEFELTPGSDLEMLIAFIIRDFYYGNTQPSRDNITGAVHLTTDYGFAFPSYRTVREYLRTADDPIYVYYFTAITELNILRRMDETIAAFPGAAHADDLGYLFYMWMTPTIVPGSVEDRALRNMVELWTNFAIYGDPTPDDSSDVIWEPVQADQFNYLHIGTEGIDFVANSVPQQERLNFWWELYQQFSNA